MEPLKLRDFILLTQELPKDKNILDGNVGDPILYHHNSIARNIRDTFLGFGYRYRLEDNPSYFASKLTLLDEMKSKKEIPYFPNFNTLVEIENKWPNRFSVEEIRQIKLFANSVMHESCHIVCSRLLAESKSIPKPGSKKFLIWANLEEAFTDTFEFIHQIKNKSEAERFSTSFNSYVIPLDNEILHLLNLLVQRYGFSTVSRLLILVSLLGHFLKKNITEETLRAIAALVEWDQSREEMARLSKFCNKLFEITSTLITEFRVSVGHFYFRSHGYEGTIQEILDFDPILYWISEDMATFEESLSRLARVLEFGWPRKDEPRIQASI